MAYNGDNWDEPSDSPTHDAGDTIDHVSGNEGRLQTGSVSLGNKSDCCTNEGTCPLMAEPDSKDKLQTGSAFSNQGDGDANGEEEREVPSSWEDESSSWIRPICIAIIAIVVVLVMRMVLPLIQVVVDSELFSPRWWIYLCMLLVPMAAIGYAIYMAIRTFISLPKGVSCRYKDYENQKGKLRTMLTKDYLYGFRRNNWLKNRIGKGAIEKLDCLCLKRNDPKYLTDDKWIEEYGEFQVQLREKAKEIKEKYAKRTACFTVLSQASRLDIVGILFFSSLMIFEIAKIFNKRMSKIGAIKTAVFWAMNLYLGGQLQNMGRNASKVTAEVVESVAKKLTGVAVANGLSLGVKALLGLGLEYQANKVLCEKLGEYAIKEFVAVKGL